VSMKQNPRHRARALVLQGLYAEEIGSSKPEDIRRQVINDNDLGEKTIEFAYKLYDLTRENQTWADEQISLMAKNWDIERMAVIDRIVLRMALTELKDMVDVPVKVVLNEAIELVKEYSTAESSSFINGILDNYAKKTANQD